MSNKNKKTMIAADAGSKPKKTMIAIPCLDMVPTLFVESLLGLRRKHDTLLVTGRSSLVYDSRNMLAQMAVDQGFDRILWLDSDMVFEPDLMERLEADLDEGRRFVAALCFTRKNPIKPVAYSETGYRQADDGTDHYQTYSECITEYPDDAVFQVHGIGMAATMMDVSVITDVYGKFGSPFSPIAGFGEDISFCRKCDELGIEMWCDSRIKVGHIAQTVVDEEKYLRGVVL